MFNAGAISAGTLLASISLAATCYESRVWFPHFPCNVFDELAIQQESSN